MNEKTDFGRGEVKRIFDLLQRLEARVTRLEDRLGLGQTSEATLEEEDEFYVSEIETPVEKERPAEGSLEFKIGEYWLAHVGTGVLLTGLAFLISYPFKIIPPIITSLFGYLAVGGLLSLSHTWQRSYQYLSKILFGGGLVLLYFATLRLHFFSRNPVLANKTVGLSVLVIVLAAMLLLSIRRQSELLTGITLFLSYASSLISDTTHFTLVLLTLASVASAYILIRYHWQAAAVISMVMAYLTHLLWFVNNPILGHPIQAISEHHNNLIYLYFYAAVFGLANLFRNRSSFTEFYEFVFTFVNGTGFFVVSSLVILTFFKSQLGLMYVLASVFYMSMATAHWIRQKTRYATSFYACFGYLALSIAIFAQFRSPDYFVWLGWQSLLVISTAIWFRSRIVIIMNILIYLGILVAYLQLAPSNDLVNLSYAVVALTSARVLNWKKERLQLKTDLIRNTYLASAFVVVLYGLYHAVPRNYVSLSWLGAALFYFGLSLAFKNIKYRWMAILTIFAMIIHVFLFDMARLDPGFRIVLFLAVGFILLLVSLMYSKYRKKISQK
jgi:hypothetical protein